jgi:hypothetical protein
LRNSLNLIGRKKKEIGGQGRDRTTDTLIFSPPLRPTLHSPKPIGRTIQFLHYPEFAARVASVTDQPDIGFGPGLVDIPGDASRSPVDCRPGPRTSSNQRLRADLQLLNQIGPDPDARIISDLICGSSANGTFSLIQLLRDATDQQPLTDTSRDRGASR